MCVCVCTVHSITLMDREHKYYITKQHVICNVSIHITFYYETVFAHFLFRVTRSLFHVDTYGHVVVNPYHFVLLGKFTSKYSQAKDISNLIKFLEHYLYIHNFKCQTTRKKLIMY